MLSKILLQSQMRADCVNNYLAPGLDEIIAILQQIEAQSDPEYQSVFSNCRKLPKGSFLLKAGQVSKRFWIMESGIARQFFIKNGSEITNDFFFPCEFIDSYGTATLRLPSKVSIQLITDASILIVDYYALKKLQIKYPALWQVEQLIAASNIYWLEERLFLLQQLSATERYILLLKRQPQIIKEIPLTYIASFLGISLPTLSRLRSKLR